MQIQSLTEQSLIEKIHQLPPEKVNEVMDFVEFLAERHTKAQDAEDVAEVRSRQANADPSQRRTLDDLRQAWGQ